MLENRSPGIRRLAYMLLTLPLISSCSEQGEQTEQDEHQDLVFYQEVSWSPDGSRLLLSRLDIQGDRYTHRLDTVQADGSGYARLTEGPNDTWGSWSPDGSRILLTADQGIYEMSLEGADRQRLVDDAFFARWSPDGRRIAWIRTTWRAPAGWPSTSAVFISDADGSGEMRLTPP